MASAVLGVCPPWGAPALPRRTAREQKAPAGGLRGPGTEQQRRGRKRWPPRSPGRGPTGPGHRRRGTRLGLTRSHTRPHTPGAAKDTVHATQHRTSAGRARLSPPGGNRAEAPPLPVLATSQESSFPRGVQCRGRRTRRFPGQACGTTATARAPGHTWPRGGAAVGALMRMALRE